MIRRIVIILLTIASIGTLALIGVSYSGATAGALPDFLAGYSPPTSSSGPRYSLFLSARKGEFLIIRNRMYCFGCGRLEPDHSPDCSPDGTLFLISWRRVVEREFGIPGLRWISYDDVGVRTNKLTISLWLMFIIFALYPVAVFVRGPIRRHRRRKRGLCLTCGYDLTGNESDRCPECGKSVGDS